MSRAPLQGLRIVGMSRIWGGAYCTQLLAYMGADTSDVSRDLLAKHMLWPTNDTDRLGYGHKSNVDHSKDKK